jgi:hypothetical protein
VNSAAKGVEPQAAGGLISASVHRRRPSNSADNVADSDIADQDRLKSRAVKGSFGLVLGAWLVTATAAAQTGDGGATRVVARKLGTEGVEAFQAGQFALAHDKLDKAYAVLRVPSLGIWSARALVKQGKLIEAMDRYAEVTRLPLGAGDQSIQRQAQIDAQAELEETEKITPSLSVKLAGAEPSAVTLRIDGAEVSTRLIGETIPVNPGPHRVEGTFQGKRSSRDVTLRLSERKELLIDFTEPEAAASAGPSSADAANNTAEIATGPDAAPRSANLRAAGWVALVGGGAGLAVGGVAGIMALSKRSSLDETPACADDHNCPTQFSGEVDTLNTLRTVSSIGFIAGGVLAATGVTLLLTTQGRDKAEASLYVSPRAVVLRGTF